MLSSFEAQWQSAEKILGASEPEGTCYHRSVKIASEAEAGKYILRKQSQKKQIESWKLRKDSVNLHPVMV